MTAFSIPLAKESLVTSNKSSKSGPILPTPKVKAESA